MNEQKKFQPSINRSSQLDEPLLMPKQNSDQSLLQTNQKKQSNAPNKQGESQTSISKTVSKADQQKGSPPNTNNTDAKEEGKSNDKISLTNLVLSQFLSKPTQFKINAQKNKLFVINKQKLELQIYSLPDFKELYPQSRLSSQSLSQIFKESQEEQLKNDESFYLDVSQDGNFILIGKKDQLMLLSTSQIFPQENLKQPVAQIKLLEDFNTEYCSARFTDSNEILIAQISDGQVNVQHIHQTADELLQKSQYINNLGIKAYSFDLIANGQVNNTENKQFNTVLIQCCLYVRFQECLYIYKIPQNMQQKPSESNQNNGTFWDPINGTKCISKKNNAGTNNEAQNQKKIQQDQNVAYNKAFQGIQQFFVNQNVLLVQYIGGDIVIYSQVLSHDSGCIVENQRINLSQLNVPIDQFNVFKFYEGNLYLNNVLDSRIEVVNFQNGVLKRLWSYKYEQKYKIFPENQIQSDYRIYLSLLENNTSKLFQINSFKNEFLFEQFQPNLRPKFSVIVGNKLFQDGENDGCLIIYDLNKSQSIIPILGDQITLKTSKKTKTFIKNIYYSNVLKMLVLVKTVMNSNSMTDQIVLMETEPKFVQKENIVEEDKNSKGENQEDKNQKGENQEYKYVQIKIGKEFSNQNIQIIGTMPSKDGEKVLLICLSQFQQIRKYVINKKDFELEQKDGQENLIFKQEKINKEDVFINQDIIVVKDQVGDNYRTYFNQEDNFIEVQNKTKIEQKNLILINLDKQNLYFLEKNEKQVVVQNIQDSNKINKIPISSNIFQILFEAAQIKQNQRDAEEQNQRLLCTENYIICQNQKEICIFDANNFEQKCQINNAPLNCAFIKCNNQNFYLIVKSSVDDLVDIKKFNILKNEQKFLPQDLNDIPKEFKLKEDQFVVFDYYEKRVELYDSEEARNMKMWTNLSSRCIISDSQQNPKNISDYVNKYSVDKISSKRFQDLLFFDTLHKQSILHLEIKNTQFFPTIIEALLSMNEEELPYLMMENNIKDGKTPLDLAIEIEQDKLKEKKKLNPKIVESLLKLIVYHKSAAREYNKHIDKHLIFLIEMKIDLSDLFQSEILFHHIKIKQLISNSNEEIEEYPLTKQELESKIQQQDQAADYYLINMNQSLMKGYDWINNPLIKKESEKSLMEVLKQNAQDQLIIFQFRCIQRIIDYKWNTYTQKYFKIHFYWFFALTILFYISLFFQQNIIEEDLTNETLMIAGYDFGTQEYSQSKIINAILTLGYTLISFFFIFNEAKQFISSSALDYFDNIWNYNDVALFTLLPIQGFIIVFQFIELQSSFMKLLKCIIIIQLFIKLNYFLRIFENFSFLVSMLQEVLISLGPFFAFFLMALSVFSAMILILVPESNDSYEGAGVFSYWMMAFRTSIGDYTFDSFKSVQMKQFTWLMWFGLMLVGNIVFMNIIIAVVNDSYKNAMTKQVSQQYLLKVNLIVEMEQQSQFTEKVKKPVPLPTEAKKKEEESKDDTQQESNSYLPDYIAVSISSAITQNETDALVFQTQMQNENKDIQRTLNKILDILAEKKINSPDQALAASDFANDSPSVFKSQLTRRQ